MELTSKKNNIISFKISDTFNIFNLINEKNNDKFIDYDFKSNDIFNIFNKWLNKTDITSKNFSLAKQELKKFKLSNEILNRINLIVSEKKIISKTLGVHIRLTDMNIGHDYSRLTINDYIKKIEEVIETSDVKDIFIASDNNESINFLLKYFENKIIINYIPDLYRAESQETSNNFTQQQYSYLYNQDQEIKKKFITDSFLDMLCLSKCGYLIHRTSNVANFAILYSDSIEKIFKLD